MACITPLRAVHNTTTVAARRAAHDSIIGLNPEGINIKRNVSSYRGNNSFQGHRREYLDVNNLGVI